MFELKQPEASRTSELEDAEDRAWSPLRDSVAVAVDEDLLQGDPDELAHLFWAGVHGVASLHLAGKLRHGLELEHLRLPMQRLLFSGNTRLQGETR